MTVNPSVTHEPAGGGASRVRDPDASLVRNGRAAGWAASAGIVAIALCGLAGWAADSRLLTSFQPGMVPINPLTAICFLLAGAGLLLLYRHPDSPAAARAAAALSAAVLAVGCLRLAGYFTDWRFTVDQALFREKLLTVPFAPNRMAPNTAFGFVLLGAGLIAAALLRKRAREAFQLPAMVLCAFAYFGLLGYLCRFATLYQITTHIPMSLPTLTAFLLGAVGLLCLRPAEGPVSLLFSATSGGYLLRRLLPVVILAPTAAAWARLWIGSGEGRADLATGTAQLTLANILVATAAVCLAGRRLHRIDLERRAVEAEVRRLNRSLSDRTEQLEAANKGLESFSYSVSHDLRSPLRHIQGYARMLAQGLEGRIEGKLPHYLESIDSSARRMGALIDDLLGFAKLGRAEPRIAAVDMENLARECIVLLKPECEGRLVTWDLQALPAAAGDRDLLRQVLINLLSNALKYSRPRGEARVEIGFSPRTGGGGAYYVRDNGVGFDMRYADKLFGVFQRLHREAEFEGSGIGLANVRSIVQRHGGKAWAEAEPGKGATFFFSIPAREGSRTAGATA